jgi:hypothetical protein
MDHNHTYAIVNGFNSLKDKHGFLLITKLLMSNSLLLKSSDSVLNSDVSAEEIANVYQNSYLFKEVKKYTTKCSRINKLSKIMQVEEDDEQLKQILNNVIMVNRIKKSLKNKTGENMDDYKLNEKVSPTFKKLLPDFYDEEAVLSYDYKNVMKFSLSDEEYNTLYEVFGLFC